MRALHGGDFALGEVGCDARVDFGQPLTYGSVAMVGFRFRSGGPLAEVMGLLEQFIELSSARSIYCLR